ncbi:hypothetical protein EV363DRAFT_1341756, partial [Boletus edulis]
HYHRECLPPRPIDAFNTSGSDDREHAASRWHSSYYRRSGSVSPLRVENEVRTSAGSKRPANALNDLCKVIRWMASKPKASLGEGMALWSENARIVVHIDKALLWSPGHFWNIQTPPNLKKTSTISRAGWRDFIALSMRDREHVADLGRLSKRIADQSSNVGTRESSFPFLTSSVS